MSRAASSSSSKESRTSAAGSPPWPPVQIDAPPAYTPSDVGAFSYVVEKDKKRTPTSPGPSHRSAGSTGSVYSNAAGPSNGLAQQRRAYQSMTTTPRSKPLTIPSLSASERSAIQVIPVQRTTLDIAHQQVVDSTAYRAVVALRPVGDLKIGVYTRASDCTEQEQVLTLDIARAVADSQRLSFFLFALLSQSDLEYGNANIAVVASSQHLVEKAAALIQAKFIGRVARASLTDNLWFAVFQPFAFVPGERTMASLDAESLHHILRRIAQDETVLDPLVPPPGSRSIDEILASARARLQRLEPRAAFDECVVFNNPAGAVLVDIRPAAQRAEHGEIPGALIIERNVLEWRFDPRCEARLDIATRYDLRVIVFCQEGYTSSLAAVALQDLGLKNATDIVGGFKAWREVRLPTIGGAISEAVTVSEA